MFNKKQIDGFILLNKNGDNDKGTNYLQALAPLTLKNKILEAKMLTDRWDQVATDIILHPSHKEFVINALSKDLTLIGGAPSIWGAFIHYSDDMPIDTGLVLARFQDGSFQKPDDPSRSVAIFPL